LIIGDENSAKCGTKKSYISRIENEGSDIRLSTLMKIVEDGLGGRIEIVFPKKKKS
jgi:transcriptional regulator with XRE-family HTH domain